MRGASNWLALTAVALVGVVAARALPIEGPVVPSHRVAFVTKMQFGTVGASAGAYDVHCHIAAGDGGLANPGTFYAFVSDSTADAYCRVQGLTGTVAGNCGMGSLPTDAGPWVRTDGFPFAGRLDLALEPGGQVFAPLSLDEYGDPVALEDLVWTGTTGYGEIASGEATGTCNDWGGEGAGAETYGEVGDVAATTTGWVSSGSLACYGIAHLICVEPGPALPLPPHRSGGAQVFVTSAAGKGRLQDWPERLSGAGVDAGDSICRNLAELAGLPAHDTFVAWLSTGSVDAKDRLSFDGPWVRPDGVLVAATKSELVSGALFSPPNQTESGEYLSNYGVWTGTAGDGTGSGLDCGDWDSDSSGLDGKSGSANFTNDDWTERWNLGCNQPNPRLYCFSNFPAVVFVDDFESGDTAAWSYVTPVGT